MEIFIHVWKKKLDPDLEQAAAEYIKRLSPFCRVRIYPHKNAFRLPSVKNSARFLIISGKGSVSSEKFAKEIAQLALSGYSRIEYLIADGSGSNFPPADSIGSVLALSGFSMSADLTAVVLAEQIYRAFTIQNNITYHK